MAVARECRSCGVDWPAAYPRFATCPICDATTDHKSGDTVEPISDDVVDSVVAHGKFELYYREREATRFAEELAALPTA